MWQFWKYFILGAILMAFAVGQDQASNDTSSADTVDTDPNPDVDVDPIIAAALEPDTNETLRESTTDDVQNSTEPSEVECKLDDDLVGEWLSTMWGNTTFTNTSMRADLHPDTNKINEFKCFKAFENGDVIFRSNIFEHFETELVYYTCMNFEKRNGNNFYVRVKTPRHRTSAASDLPLEMRPVSKDEGHSHSRYCQSSPVNGFLIRTGKELEGAMGCPDTIKGIFNVTYKGTTQLRCPDGALLTTCEAPKILSIVHSDCGDNSTTYPESDDFICIGGGAYEVTLFRNSTEQNDFTPFSCMTLAVDANDNSTVEAVQKGNGCGEMWHLPQGNIHEEELTLEKTDECLPEEVIPPEVTAMFESNDTNIDDLQPGSNATAPINSTGVYNSTATNGTEEPENPEDAANFLVSNGFFVTFIVAVLAILVSQQDNLA